MVKYFDDLAPTKEFLKDFNRVDILRGNFIQNIDSVASSGTAKIKHGLNRKYLGYIIVSMDADTRFYEDTSNNLRPQDELWLVNAGSNSANIKVYVF